LNISREGDSTASLGSRARAPSPSEGKNIGTKIPTSEPSVAECPGASGGTEN